MVTLNESPNVCNNLKLHTAGVQPVSNWVTNIVRDREKNEQSFPCTYGQVCSARLAGEKRTRPLTIVRFQNTDRGVTVLRTRELLRVTREPVNKMF